MICSIQLPPEIIDGLIALGSALLGWLARLLSTKKKIGEMKDENEVLKEAVKEYNTIAREAIRNAEQAKLDRARARVGKKPVD